MPDRWTPGMASDHCVVVFFKDFFFSSLNFYPFFPVFKYFYILYLHKSQIRPRVLLSYLGGNSPVLTSPSRLNPKASLDSCCILQPFPHIQITQSLSMVHCFFFHGLCSHELHSLVQPVLTMKARISHASHIVVTYPHSLYIQIVSREFHSSRFFPWTNVLWKRFPRGCFHDQ